MEIYASMVVAGIDINWGEQQDVRMVLKLSSEIYKMKSPDKEKNNSRPATTTDIMKFME